MSIKIRINQSGVLMYAVADTQNSRVENSKKMLAVPRQNGTIGVRGRMLVKRYSSLLGETILSCRESYPVYSEDNKINGAFVTLTLPSKQKHSDGELNRSLLGRFIVEARREGYFNHYVWRAEVQKNGNAHWHLLIDKELDHVILRKLWNKILVELGYISDYQERMRSLTLQDYIDIRKPDSDLGMKKAILAFQQGVAEGWTNPNSTDIQRVKSVAGMKRYISKYMSKKGDDDRRGFESRHWGCSDSLRELYECREVIDVQEVKTIMRVATDLNLKIFGMEHVTFICCNKQELRNLNPLWYDLLMEREAYNVNRLFGMFSVISTVEVGESVQLLDTELDALYFTVCETQLNLEFPIEQI